MACLGRLMGAVDALRLITNGPGPPSLAVSAMGASKSSMLRCQISPVSREFVGCAINGFPRKIRVRREYWLIVPNETVMGVAKRRQRALAGSAGTHCIRAARFLRPFVELNTAKMLDK
jgi:hypothetical protein